MDSSPALLLLLALGLCEYGHGAGQPLQREGEENPSTEPSCPGIHGQPLMRVRSHNDISQLRVGQRLELECHTDRDSGMSWIHQDKRGTLHFIVFISSLAQSTFMDQSSLSRFEARKEHLSYRLIVKSFTAQDEGKYFCLMNINQMLFFSNGLPVFLPVINYNISVSDTGGPFLFSIPAERTQEDLNYFCLAFLWVPSTGLCLLLLQLLATTIVLRRRRTHKPL
ncbi:CD8A protein, partial [Malurus elegans]|nr:CD8A protein [Malurus elegans]